MGDPGGTSREAKTDADLLADLEEAERSLSSERRRLHDRIDHWGPTEELLERERDVSRRRRELHAQIDELRSRNAEES